MIYNNLTQKQFSAVHRGKMQRVSRLRFIILATIACVILFCIAAFSVSLAEWDGGGSGPSAEVEGESGLFYVEYPLYTSSGEEVEPPALTAGTYYMQVTAANNTNNTSDYYAMETNNNAEKKLLSVHLRVGDTLAVYNGTNFRKINKNNGQDRSSLLTLNNDGKYTVKSDGLYDFYYVFADDAGYFWINRSDYVEPTPPNPSDYPLAFKVKFSDVDEVKTMHFKAPDGYSTPCAYIWTGDDSDGSTIHYYNTSWTVAKNTGSGIEGGSPYQMSIAGSTAVKVGEYNKTKIIFNDGTSWGNKQSGTIYLNTLAFQADNYITLGTTPVNDSSTGATLPTLTGATMWGDDVTITEKTGDTTVRQAVMTGTANGDGSYTYQNYVCVSRLGDSSTDNDNTICYLAFEIVDEDENQITDNTTAIRSIDISRAETGDDGVPTGANVGVPPRLYGAESVSTLSEINYTVRATEDRRYPEIMVESYYNNGMYCVLFFGDDDQQYFALDIKITTETEVTQPFYLKATASNINHWQRYIDGYGQPFTFYMGGLINDVWTWDPRRTTQFDDVHSEDEYTYERVKFNDSANGDSQYDYYVKYPTIPIDITLTVNLTANSIIKAYMLGQSGYRWDGTGDAPVGLENGAETTRGRIAYLLPEQIISSVSGFGYFKDASSTLTDVNDLNLYVPVTGEYTFRYVGNVRMRANSGNIVEYVNVNTGTMGTCNGNSVPAGCYGISNANFVVEKLYVTTTATATEYTVTFDSNGGSAVEAQTVKFGQKATRPDDPTKEGDETFTGWYTEDDELYDFSLGVTTDIALHAVWTDEVVNYIIEYELNGGTAPTTANPTSFTLGDTATTLNAPTPPTGKRFVKWAKTNNATAAAVTAINNELFAELNAGATVTLYAIYENTYTVTFNSMSGSTVQSQEIAEGAKATKPANPTRDGYTFDSWYTDSACSMRNEYDFNSEVTEGITLYARWIPSLANSSGHYYMVGTMSEWKPQQAYYLGENSGFRKVTFSADAEFKVAQSSGSSTSWNGNEKGYNMVAVKPDEGELVSGEGAGNINIKSGTYIIYLRADGKIEIYTPETLSESGGDDPGNEGYGDKSDGTKDIYIKGEKVNASSWTHNNEDRYKVKYDSAQKGYIYTLTVTGNDSGNFGFDATGVDYVGTSNFGNAEGNCNSLFGTGGNLKCTTNGTYKIVIIWNGSDYVLNIFEIESQPVELQPSEDSIVIICSDGSIKFTVLKINGYIYGYNGANDYTKVYLDVTNAAGTVRATGTVGTGKLNNTFTTTLSMSEIAKVTIYYSGQGNQGPFTITAANLYDGAEIVLNGQGIMEYK